MLHPFTDRNRLRQLLERDPVANVRARNVLFGLHSPPDVRILVDDPERPRAALLTADGMLWDLCWADLDSGRATLERFEPEGPQVVLVGLAEPLVEHAARRFRIVGTTPTTLHVLRDPADFHPDPCAEPVDELAPGDTETVSGTWPHDDFGSPEAKLAYIRARIERGPTAAVLRDGRLVSFALTHDDGSVGMLHTAPEARRQGLGRRVLSSVAGRLVARGAPLFGFVARGNTPSETLLTSLGMRPATRGAWVTIARSGRP
jgi:ribosomal protein S18 acetylase RimI-like enzyme